jgi:hypothetical protein
MRRKILMNCELSGCLRFLLPVFAAFLSGACATGGDPSSQGSIKIEPSIIAVSTPGAKIPQGSGFAWLSGAINLYRDERLDSTTIQYLIEKNIKANLVEMGYSFVEFESAADYKIAYTAALESSLDDTAILRRYGLVPGNMNIPENNPSYEKGTLLIYVFDNITGNVIWRSAVQAAVDFSLDESERKARLEPIIRDMFRTMPGS